MIRVLLVSGEYPPMQGGVGDYTDLLAAHLAGLGLHVGVVTRDAAGSLATTATGDARLCASSADRTVAAQGNVDVFRRVRRWDFGALRAIARLAEEWRADVIHWQYQAAAYDMRAAANLSALLMRSRPVAVTFHDLKVPYLFPKAGPLRPLAIQLLAATARACVATNDEDAASLRRLRLARPSTVDVIPIGSNILPTGGTERYATRQRLGIAADEVMLAYFGFLHPSKGVDVLLRALAELVESGLPVRLLMIGGQAGDSDLRHDEYRRTLHGSIEQARLGGRVLWTGFIEREAVSAHLAASDVAALPFAEGASWRHGTLHAAIAHGLPIVTTLPRTSRGDGVLPTPRDGIEALLVPSGDAHRLAEAIACAARSPELRARLAQGALQLAKHFGWPAIAERTVAVYERMLGSVAGSGRSGGR